MANDYEKGYAPPRNGSWWKSPVLAVVVGLMVGAAGNSILYIIGQRVSEERVNNRINVIEAWREGELKRWQNSIDSSITRMDKEGTYASHYGIEKEKDKLKENTDRLDKDENQIEVMKEKVLRLEQHQLQDGVKR